MSEIKDSLDLSRSTWQRPVVSPEWELFRATQQMSWGDLKNGVQSGILDMYRSIELGLNLQKALASPKLSQLGDKHGKDLVCRLIGLTLTVYFGRLSANPEAHWGTWRLRQTAEWLFETYSHESLRDLMYAFRREQGKFVHDLSTVMTDYLEWRAAKLEETHQARCQADVNPWPDDFKEKLPERWFLGYLTQPHANDSKNAA
ncbi:hypothetical protein [Salmonirosea aquatica]|uniref:Uncharacterized protein n=1 Tax=Salmonirosea aquatica TaxID=2654236 RepID=A0A7C9BEH4_9BACT|nr:hypothetical protein [Cytophagaceae bacterium SJW1-29]